MSHFDDRDNSPEAITERYDKAKMMAIVDHNATMFDSIRDVFYLLKQLDEAQKKEIYYKDFIEKVFDSLGDNSQITYWKLRNEYDKNS